MERMISMIFRMILRRVIGAGVNAAISKAQEGQADRTQSRRVRKSLRTAQRIGRL